MRFAEYFISNIDIHPDLVHGDEHNGHANKEVDGELVSEHYVRHDCGENGRDGARVFLEDRIGKLVEE